MFTTGARTAGRLMRQTQCRGMATMETGQAVKRDLVKLELETIPTLFFAGWAVYFFAHHHQNKYFKHNSKRPGPNFD